MMTCFLNYPNGIYETVREDEGASYGVGVSGSISLYRKTKPLCRFHSILIPEKRAKMSSLIDKGINDFYCQWSESRKPAKG